MKVKDCKNWKKVIFSDRSILPKDVRFFSREQSESFMNVCVEPVPEMGRGVYIAVTE